MAEISDIMIEKLAKAILRAANTQQTKKPKDCTADAEVLRVENGVAYVHITGGAPETPARKGIGCKAGDTVQVRLENGKASLAGNPSSPPTDDTKAEEAAQLAEAAREAADEAQETADNIKQYFWFKNGEGNEAGAHVTEVPRAEFQKNPQGGNLLLRSNSVKLRMALITLAELTGTSLTFYDPNTNEWRIKLDTDGAHLKGKTVSNSYSYADLLAQVFRIGYHSALNNEDIISEFFGYQGFSNYMYARKTMTNTPPSFRSTVHDENGFRFVRDNGTNPQTIGTAANSYLFESGGLKEDGLRLGWVYGGALRSLTDVNAPEADGDHIFVSESENGTQLVDVIYDEASDEADMDLSGDLTAGSVEAGAVRSSGNVTAAGKLIGANLDAGSDTAATAASGSTTTKTVSFNKTFTAAPKVVVGFTYDNSATGTTNSFGNCAISAVDITTTGFTAKFYNGSGTQKTPTFDWIALLP